MNHLKRFEKFVPYDLTVQEFCKGKIDFGVIDFLLDMVTTEYIDSGYKIDISVYFSDNNHPLYIHRQEGNDIDKWYNTNLDNNAVIKDIYRNYNDSIPASHQVVYEINVFEKNPKMAFETVDLNKYKSRILKKYPLAELQDHSDMCSLIFTTNS